MWVPNIVTKDEMEWNVFNHFSAGENAFEWVWSLREFEKNNLIGQSQL